MNREAIKRTAICRYDSVEKEYIVESPLLDICHGIAESKKEAWNIFGDLIDSMYIEYLEGKGVGKYGRGRPPKGRTELHTQVNARTKKGLAALAKKLGVSQGEVMDFLLFFYDCHHVEDTPAPAAKKKHKSAASR